MYVFEEVWGLVTAKSFSSTPIDLILEQTINTDASSQRFGITQFRQDNAGPGLISFELLLYRHC